MKKRFFVISLLFVIGMISLYFLVLMPRMPQKFGAPLTPPDSSDRTDKDASPTLTDKRTAVRSLTWSEWLDKQVDIQLEELFRLAAAEYPETVADLEDDIVNVEKSMRESLQMMMVALKNESDTPPPLLVIPIEDMPRPEDVGVKRHEGAQTAEAIVENFKGMTAHLTTPELDMAYPQEEWIQMLLDRGIVINDYADYSGYMTARGHLPWLEAHPEAWHWAVPASRLPPTEDVTTLDWETIRRAYIDQQVYQYETLREARATDPSIGAGIFIDGGQTFLPVREKQVYARLKRYESGSLGYGTLGASLTEEQRFNLFYRGIEPEGYDVTYIDYDNQILSEPFQPIRPEEALGPEEYKKYLQNQNQLPDSAVAPPAFAEEGQNAPDIPQVNRINAAEDRHNDFETLFQEKMKEWATLSDTEFEAELQKLFSPSPPHPHDIGETFIPKPITRKRFDEAFQEHSGSGYESGIQKLYERDPELAKRIEHQLQRQSSRHDTQERREPKHPGPPKR